MIKKLHISVIEISWVSFLSMPVILRRQRYSAHSTDPVAYSISCCQPFNLRNGTSNVAVEINWRLLDEHTVVLLLLVQ